MTTVERIALLLQNINEGATIDYTLNGSISWYILNYSDFKLSNIEKCKFRITRTYVKIDNTRAFELLRLGESDKLKTETSDIRYYGWNRFSSASLNLLADDSDIDLYEEIIIENPEIF